MSEEGVCNHPEEHHLHLCVLAGKLSKKELDPLRKNPKYVCANCGGRVDSGRNLCRPVKIRE